MSVSDLPGLDQLAGFAALVNGLLLWPVVRSLKALAQDHHERLQNLESNVVKSRPRRRPRPKP